MLVIVLIVMCRLKLSLAAAGGRGVACLNNISAATKTLSIIIHGVQTKMNSGFRLSVPIPPYKTIFPLSLVDIIGL